MNWDDPEARLALIEQVGADECNRRLAEHLARQTVATANGKAIRLINTMFGQLYAVDGTNRAFRTLEEAKGFAERRPNIDD